MNNNIYILILENFSILYFVVNLLYIKYLLILCNIFFSLFIYFCVFKFVNLMRLDKQFEKYKKEEFFGVCNKYYWIRFYFDEMGLFQNIIFGLVFFF